MFNTCTLIVIEENIFSSYLQKYPPTKSTHQQVLRALVGALAEGSGEERAARFIVDLVAAQLHVQVRI